MLQIMNRAHRGLTSLGLSKLRSEGHILDVSCGGGNDIYMMMQMNRFEHIYGIDFSQDAVSLAKQKNRKNIESGKVTIAQASVLVLDGYFDAVTTFQSHYHWPDVLRATQEVNRVLKPGGQFVLVAEIYKIEYHMRAYNNAVGTKALLVDSGFTNIEAISNQKCICVSGYKPSTDPEKYGFCDRSPIC